MNKSDIPYSTKGFEGYIENAYDLELMEGLKKSKETISEIAFADLDKIADKAYAPGKWTVKQLFQHLADTERIMTYRALRFARRDKTPLPGFEENNYAAFADVSKRSLKEIIEELILIRETTIKLFGSFDKETLMCEGMASNKNITVLSLGYIISGHQVHHYNILKERYLPLLK